MVTTVTALPPDSPLDEAAIHTWLKRVGKPYSAEERELIERACGLALPLYAGRHGLSGESLGHAVLAVAEILIRTRLEAEAVAAAILEHVPEAPALTEPFGETIATMVADLQRIAQLSVGQDGSTTATSPGKAHAENLRRMLLGLARDVRVVLIVLAERLHLMRTLKRLSSMGRRCALARETLEIHAPLANRLGISQIKWELEDLSLRYLHPEEYQRIAKRLGFRRQDRERFIGEVIRLLDEKLRAIGIQAEITGRPKHIYSIWKKMQRKGVDIDQIFDLRAVRVLVEDVAQCYATLGVVHGLWRPIPGEFDDYIATPKANMYQSLHTAVVGPKGKALEVQIRTFDMHHHAELGIAAHWRYKENARHDSDFDRRVVWMRQWLDRRGAGRGGDEGESPTEMEPERIYVLTPQSQVIELPTGATPLDFAYAIHTDIGHRCRGAMVDGRIVPLTQPLRSGQTVEILTHKHPNPSRDWLNPQRGYLKTSKARNRVRSWFKHLDFEEHVAAGRNSLEREMQRLGLRQRPDLTQAGRRYNLKGEEELYAAIGRGDLSPAQVLGAERAEIAAAAPAPEAHPSPREPGPRGAVVVEGEGNLLTHIARCCKPVPYDPITAYVTRGHGVTIHRSDCHNLRHLREREAERLLEAHWGRQPEATYAVDIRVVANDRKGLLRDISSIISNEDIDVVGVHTHTDRRHETATMRFTLEISDINELESILNKISALPEVMDAKRLI